MAYKIVNDDSLTSVANAIRVQGSISGTLEFPDGFVSAIQNLSPSPTLQTKTKTYTPTTSQQTESVVADSGYDGLDEVDVTVNAIPSQYKDTTDATATADKILQGYTAYANGQKLVGTASGGITPSGTIQITQNGQVDVTQYAIADVNVSGGGGSSWELLASREYTFETVLPTTASQIDSLNLSASDVYTKSKIIVGVARKKNPTMDAREHIGTDSFFINKFAPNGQTETMTAANGRTMWNYNMVATGSSALYTFGVSGFNASGGVFINTISSSGTITVSARSLSGYDVVGDYTLDIYALSWPVGAEPFGV